MLDKFLRISSKFPEIHEGATAAANRKTLRQRIKSSKLKASGQSGDANGYLVSTCIRYQEHLHNLAVSVPLFW